MPRPCVSTAATPGLLKNAGVGTIPGDHPLTSGLDDSTYQAVTPRRSAHAGVPVIEIVRERTLNVPLNQVWDLIEPVERLCDWFTGIETAERLAGQGLGRKQRVGGRWGRHRFQIDQTVTHYELRRRLVWRHDTERLDGKPAPTMSRETEFGIQLRDLAPGTLVRLTSRQLPQNVLKGLLVRLIAAPRIARMMERSLATIPEILAQRPAGAAGVPAGNQSDSSSDTG